MNGTRQTESTPYLSVVIPVYNEEENVEPAADATVAALRAWGRAFEVVFVDDGSTDSTAVKLRAIVARYPEVRAVRITHAGQTAAFEAGFHAARGAIIGTIDGDCQNDPADLPRLAARLEQGDVDMVNGYRRKRNDSVIRRISSRVANHVRNWATRGYDLDTGCSTRVFRRECVERIQFFNGLHRFFPTLVRMRGFRTTELPVNHRPRCRGKSKYGIHNRLWRGIRDLLAVRWMQDRVLRYEVIEEWNAEREHPPAEKELAAAGGSLGRTISRRREDQ
jgi:dolichol-phosphate mannosyltransferase